LSKTNLPSIQMAQHPSYSVVLTYAEDQKTLSVRAVEHGKLAPLLADKLDLPILLEEFDFRLDDEFARRLGTAVLNPIALGQPEIMNYMSLRGV
jgi:hypothetical protein